MNDLANENSRRYAELLRKIMDSAQKHEFLHPFYHHFNQTTAFVIVIIHACLQNRVLVMDDDFKCDG